MVSWDHPDDVTAREDEHVSGRIIYGGDGQMAVVLASTSRPKIGLSRLLARFTRGKHRANRLAFGYAGSYEVHGNEVIHHVEVSTIPAYAGLSLPRTLSLQGSELRLLYVGPAGQGVMNWRRKG